MPEYIRNDMLNAFAKRTGKSVWHFGTKGSTKEVKGSLKQLNGQISEQWIICGTGKGNNQGTLKEMDIAEKTKEDYSHRKYSSFVIDIMGIVCKLKLTSLSTIHDLLLTFVSTVHVYHQFGRRNYVFDMNSDDPSVKDNERLRRTNTIPIEHNFVKAGTSLPREMETF